MEQTNAGRRLCELSKGLMKSIDRIDMIMKDESGGSRCLRIGIPPYGQHYYPPEHLVAVW